MTNRERTIKWLECCGGYNDELEHVGCSQECPYWESEDCCNASQPYEDALKLLKEHEALPIVYQNNEYTGLPMAHCPSCGEYLVQFHSGVDGKESRFCYYCGQAVKWND